MGFGSLPQREFAYDARDSHAEDSITTKERLHWLVDQIKESDWPEVEEYLAARAAGDDPVLRALLTAPEDDEPETDEEREAVREALEDIAAGRLIPHEQVRREVFGD